MLMPFERTNQRVDENIGKKMQAVELVSIIMPVFNGRQFIAEAVESVLLQTYQNFELIILDDGSDDETYSFVAKQYGDDPRIKLMGPFLQQGPFKLRNIGVTASRGSYVAFLDADDVWGENKLAAQISFLEENKNVGLSHTNVEKIDADSKVVGRFDIDKRLYSGECFYEMLKLNGVCNSSVVVRREIFEMVGLFDEEFRYRGDWDMWTRISQKYAFVYLDALTTKYRLHSTNVSNDYTRLKPYAFGIWTKFYNVYCVQDPRGKKILEATYTNLTYSFALMELVGRSYEMARKDFKSVISRQPLNIGAWIGLVKSLIYPLLKR